MRWNNPGSQSANVCQFVGISPIYGINHKSKDWLQRLNKYARVLKKTGPQKVNVMETFVMSFLITSFPEFNFLTISFTHCIRNSVQFTFFFHSNKPLAGSARAEEGWEKGLSKTSCKGMKSVAKDFFIGHVLVVL